jgi:hypothetical protein
MPVPVAMKWSTDRKLQSIRWTSNCGCVVSRGSTHLLRWVCPAYEPKQGANCSNSLDKARMEVHVKFSVHAWLAISASVAYLSLAVLWCTTWWFTCQPISCSSFRTCHFLNLWIWFHPVVIRVTCKLFSRKFVSCKCQVMSYVYLC